MSQYPDALSDLAWFRQQIEGLQAEVRELQRGPAVPQPTLLFGTYAAMVAVVGAPLQWAYVSDGVPGRVGPWRYFPGLGWQRDWDTGEVVAYTGSVAPKWSLPASGGTYNVSDYPDLAARYGVSSGKFVVRNLGGRVLVGAGTVADANGTIRTFAQGDTGGELTHAMTVPELVSHTHSSSSVFALVNAGGAGAWNWGLFNERGYSATTMYQSLSSNGGSQPFNVMQPYAALPLAVRI